MTAWAEIKDIVASGELQRLKRGREETERYHEHKRVLAEQNISIGDYVLSKLGWTAKEIEELNAVDDDMKLKMCFSREGFYKVTGNDFPYDFEPDVFHLLIWSKINLPLYTSDEDHAEMRADTRDKIEEFIEQNLTQYLNPETDDYSWFINYRSLQSIRGVSHVHLLIYAPANKPSSTLPSSDQLREQKGQRAHAIATELLKQSFKPLHMNGNSFTKRY